MWGLSFLITTYGQRCLCAVLRNDIRIERTWFLVVGCSKWLPYIMITTILSMTSLQSLTPYGTDPSAGLIVEANCRAISSRTEPCGADEQVVCTNQLEFIGKVRFGLLMIFLLLQKACDGHAGPFIWKRYEWTGFTDLGSDEAEDGRDANSHADPHRLLLQIKWSISSNIPEFPT